MRKRGKMKRFLSLILTALMLLSLLPVTVLAASDTYQKVADGASFTTGRYVMVTDTGYAPGVLDGTWITAQEITNAGDALENPVDAAVWDITVTGDQAVLTDSNGVSVAPKGGNNNGISQGGYQWKWTFENGKFTFSGQGEDTVILASNKGSQNKFRGYKTTTVSGNPNAYPSEFTLYKLQEGGSGVATVAAPSAVPQAGEVETGTRIQLSTVTAGAEIYFTLDGSDPADSGTRELYSADNQPEITEDCTLKAVAVLDGSYSEVQQLKYTVKEGTLIGDGDQVVIYAPAYMKALSAEYSGFYNKGTDVEKSADGVLSGYTQKDVWTVVDNGDGTYSFSYNGQNIGMGDSYSSMPLGEKNDRWVLENAGNGLYYVKNTVRDAYMEWYDSNGNWSAYYNIAEGSEGMFALEFCQVTAIPDTPNEPSGDVEGLEVEASPVSGASVTAGQEITLEAADGAEIYFTMNTDGTEPADPEAGNEAQKYTEAIEIAETPRKRSAGYHQGAGLHSGKW